MTQGFLAYPPVACIFIYSFFSFFVQLCHNSFISACLSERVGGQVRDDKKKKETDGDIDDDKKERKKNSERERQTEL